MTSANHNSDEQLKAVIFADSCNAEAAPNLASGKKVLNTSILTWQLAVLARSGVKEAVILSSKPVSHHYSDPLQRLHVSTLSSSSWNGEDDALRDLDRHDDLRPTDDFVLVTAGSLFNVDVSKLVDQHKKPRSEDRNWLLTTVFRHGAGTAWKGLIAVVEKRTGTLVKYTTNNRTAISIDVLEHKAALQSGAQFDFVSNVLDCGLDEKLDGGEAEVFGNRMYAHFVDSAKREYASRITSLASFAQTTLDVLNGWMQPYEEQVFNDHAKNGQAHQLQTAYVVENCAVEDNFTIDMSTHIFDSGICNNVKIGKDVSTVRSIVMDGTEIADRSYVRRSILEKERKVLMDSIIPDNCYFKSGQDTDEEGHEVREGHEVDKWHEIEHGQEDVKEQEDAKDGEEGHNEEERIKEDEVEERGGEEGEHEDDEEEDVDGEGVLFGEENDGAAPDNDNAADVMDHEADAPEVLDAELKHMVDLSHEWSEGDVSNVCDGRLVEYSYAVALDPFFIEHPVTPNYESDERDELEEDEDEEDEYVDAVDRVLERDERGANGDIDEIVAGMHTVNLQEEANASNDDNRMEEFVTEAFEKISRTFEEDIDEENTALEVNSLKLAYHTCFAEKLAAIYIGIAQAVEKSEEGVAEL
ncbi:putative translation initiation factor eIF-2B subunit epsilon [Gracilariopsis chorda]|uniref:Putative translation initiation factor eIF-2B subunit epsilon n=1 Tax=Gracilariopsis chorda TaxID=448386 RepID=A0A2V3ITQ2_9FLOR|nr:putative translation initiation factor eIF-2B subunit epsilon [Gracilariopsis chorda]|eukprot:PXF45501.1 putative translation initiation factor eIF-2B subunit epsilon [Gracilariopsis chorda]